MTHRAGVVCVRDRTVLRTVSNELIGDEKLVVMFSEMHDTRRFQKDDLMTVYMKYIYRVETMVGNELCRQLMDGLKLTESRLGSLRQNKRNRDTKVKGIEGSSSSKKGSTSNTKKGSSSSKKKKKRRKKKNW